MNQSHHVEPSPYIHSNVRRYVACVNACAGIPTDDLEQCPSGGLFHLADMANEVVKQRDELLAALEFACKKIADLHLEAGDGDCHYPIINDAIASVKGGAA